MRLKLFKKYYFTTAVIIVFSLTIMMMILTLVFNSRMADEKYKSLHKTCNTVADFSLRIAAQEDPEERSLYYIISNLSDVTDFDIFVAENNGTIKVCSCDTWGSEGTCRHTAVILPNKVIESGKENYTGLDTLGIYAEPHYISSIPIENKAGETVGFVVAASPILAIQALMKTVVKLYMFSAFVPMVLMFFAIYAMTYRMTKPLRQMSEAAKAMARGDFSRRIPVTSDDEIGELAVSFNQMTNSLVQLESMRRSFVADISHELKTPMTTIGGFIDGIIDGTIEHEKQIHYLTIASNEVKRLSRMVQSMLSVARLESGEFIIKPETFDFRELLLMVVLSQEQRIEKRHLNITGLEEVHNVAINADKDLIYQVVYNLVDNAVKFTNESGTIDFKIRADGKRMIFDITNTGKGIPAAQLPYVFERFYKVDKSRSANKNSTGLGLYIVKTIVRTHGGSITVSSKENEFTTFEVTLPIAKK